MSQPTVQLAKLFLILGAILICLGLLILLAGRLGFFKLPGDFSFETKNVKIFFPLVSCLIISILLTLILWIINHFRH